jgi:hypothetical protein
LVNPPTNAAHPGPARDSDDSRFRLFVESFLDQLGDRKSAAKILKEQAPALHEQADIAARTLEIFRSGAVIVDEVDLILHPLKRYSRAVRASSIEGQNPSSRKFAMLYYMLFLS